MGNGRAGLELLEWKMLGCLFVCWLVGWVFILFWFSTLSSKTSSGNLWWLTIQISLSQFKVEWLQNLWTQEKSAFVLTQWITSKHKIFRLMEDQTALSSIMRPLTTWHGWDLNLDLHYNIFIYVLNVWNFYLNWNIITCCYFFLKRKL